MQRGALLGLSCGPDGRAAGLVARDSGRQVWIFDADGRVLEIVGQPGALSNIAWTPTGGVACADSATGRPLLSLECGRSRGRSDLGEVRGPIAVASDGGVFVGRPNAAGTVDLWRQDPATGSGARLTGFGRDTYAPYLLDDGRVLFKLQQYTVTIARVGAGGGMTMPVTSFQSETPSWDWSGERIAFTFGSWRRLVDDARYPDITQQIGVVRVADGIAAAPQQIVRHSASEDQGMHWSPNGRWIVLHSHADGTDDIWLQPADGSAPAVPITHGGNETGWPRFSPDGHWIVYPTDHRGPDGDRLGLLQLLGFDQERGRVFIGEFAEVPQGGDVPVHGEECVAHDEGAGGFWAPLFEQRREAIHVGVGVDHHASPREAAAIDNGGVVEGVRNNGVVGAEDGLESAAVGVEARRVEDGVVHS